MDRSKIFELQDRNNLHLFSHLGLRVCCKAGALPVSLEQLLGVFTRESKGVLVQLFKFELFVITFVLASAACLGLLVSPNRQIILVFN